jgi:acyl-CoA thioesterase-1
MINSGFWRRALTAYGHERRFRQMIFALLAMASLALPSVAQARTLHIVALGDSLTAGYNLPADAAFPAVLQKALREKGYDVVIDNAGVSGDTSSGARERLDWALAEGADGVIVEIGANDMLRGLNPDLSRDNIDAILARLREKGIPALLAGMVTAPNLGPDYAAQFNPIYPDLAKKFGVPLYPFFLEGVAGHKDKQLPDGLHPNRQGVDAIVAGILPLVTKWLDGLNRI